jgi:hypothetical protein
MKKNKTCNNRLIDNMDNKQDLAKNTVINWLQQYH